MTTKDAIKHLSDKIDYAEQCDDKWVDSVSIKALYIAVKAMTEERKKGKWMDMGDYCVCNQCWHTEQQFNGVERIPRHTPFCAMCGADMREEKNDVGSKV